MDKKTVNRVFNILVVAPEFKDEKLVRESYSLLQMLSTYEGEYGRVSFLCEAQLDTREQDFHCYVLEDSAQPVDSLFLLRYIETLHFLTKILPLFNPSNHFPDALPFPSPSQSQDS